MALIAAAYGLIWLLIGLYLFHLDRQHHRLSRELAAMREEEAGEPIGAAWLEPGGGEPPPAPR